MLAAVRKDAGVNFVECDLEPEPALVLATNDLSAGCKSSWLSPTGQKKTLWMHASELLLSRFGREDMLGWI